MKRILPILALSLLVFAACSNEPTGTDQSAVDNQSLVKAVEQFQPNMDQFAMLDEMYYLDEDLSTILSPKQQMLLMSFFDGGTPGRMGPAGDRRLAFDMGGFMYVQLILKANPDLDEATKQALVAILTDYASKRLQAIQDNAGDRAALEAALKLLHEQMMAALNAAITPAQLANVQALQAKIQAEREARRQAMEQRRIDMEVQMLTRLLGLTEEQAAALKALLTQRYAAISALQQNPPSTPEEMRIKMQAIMDAFNAEVAKILTPDQLIKWNRLNDWRNHRGGGGGGIINPRG